MKKIVFATISMSIGLVASVSAAFTPSAWKYIRPIDIQGQSGILSAHIPEDISWTARDYSDIRIIDGQGNEVPYLLSRNSTSSANTSNARLIDMTQGQDGSTRFVADFGSTGVVRTAVHIGNSSANFRRQVSVYSSDSLIPLDSSGWSPVTSQGYIFTFTDPYTGASSGKDTVSFSPHAARYYKVVIGAGIEGPVIVNAISGYRDVTVSALSYSRTVTGAVYNNPTKKTSELTLDLGAVGRVSSSVTINSSDTNYSRRVIVDVSDTGATSSWVYAGQSSISNISTSVFKGYSNRVDYPEQRARFIRLSVVNDDNPALSLSQTATVTGPVLSVIFEAHPGVSYSLYYGNPLARQPEYDIARIVSYIDQSTLAVAPVGSESLNPLYVAPPEPVVPFTESHAVLLNILLVLVVVGIGVVIFMYLRTYMRNKGRGNFQK